MLCLDLDRFKSVNDTLGHPVGDALLQQVSVRLLGCVRQGDVVARLGGDEFAIVQANVCDPDDTEALAARIVDTVSKPYDIAGQRIDISTSIGMTLAPRDGADADQLMKNADLALYRAKADGRQGYSFFEPQMNEHSQVRRRMELDLRKAFDNEELALFYQPIICLETQRVTGFEALMRWTHPKRGAVPPAEFIALAEEIGLISELGEWALRRACTQAARWSAPVKVAINLSPLQIKRDLIEVVLQALAASGLPPERLELEITESVLLQDRQNTHGHAAPAAPARGAHRHGRFRHRLLLAELSAQLPLRQDQDRPGVHRRHRPQRRVAGDRRYHRQARPVPGHGRRWPKASRTSSS